ncbi:hypothetical protein CSIM01_00563 [Colletotrichum simmondsii]|uniref:Uncharacterized protein n=1 Tax=Colletotrichum simmondsii TaxID=703756 RepID=A0A135SIW9_9PEZI|nr:hypothetical protein CSIM01_00563 [Colletotrichum simmondsii]
MAAASKATNPTGRKPTGSLSWTGAVYWSPPFFSGLSLSNFLCLPVCLPRPHLPRWLYFSSPKQSLVAHIVYPYEYMLWSTPPPLKIQLDPTRQSASLSSPVVPVTSATPQHGTKPAEHEILLFFARQSLVAPGADSLSKDERSLIFCIKSFDQAGRQAILREQLKK